MNTETMEFLQKVYNDTRTLMRRHYGDLPNLTIRTHINGYSKNPHDLSAWRPCITLDAYRNVNGEMDRSFKISATGQTWSLAIAKLASSVVEHFREMEESFAVTEPFQSPSMTVGQFSAIAERLENSILGICERLDKLEQGSETEESHDS